jgi:hypothetical protein
MPAAYFFVPLLGVPDYRPYRSHVGARLGISPFESTPRGYGCVRRLEPALTQGQRVWLAG